MQIYLLPEIPASGGYENIISAIHVFSRYAFAYPKSNRTAVKTATVITDVKTRHACLPTVIMTVEGSVFVSKVMHEVAEVLGITIRHATTEHSQTIGVLEVMYATMKNSLKMSPQKRHKDLQLAILNYNTRYHTGIGYEPSRIFHEQVPCTKLDHKLGLKLEKSLVPTTDSANEMLRRTQNAYDRTKKNVLQTCIRYKKDYDEKVEASPLQEKDHCYILQTRADHQGSKIPFRYFRWIGTYVAEKAQRRLHSPENGF